MCSGIVVVSRRYLPADNNACIIKYKIWWLGVDAEGLPVNYFNRRDRHWCNRGTRSLTITVATHHRSCQWRRVRERAHTHTQTHTRAHAGTRTHGRALLWLRPRPRYGSLIRPLLRAAATTTTRRSPPRFTPPPAHIDPTLMHATMFNRARGGEL